MRLLTAQFVRCHSNCLTFTATRFLGFIAHPLNGVLSSNNYSAKLALPFPKCLFVFGILVVGCAHTDAGVWRHACAASADHRALFSHDLGSNPTHRPTAASSSSATAFSSFTSAGTQSTDSVGVGESDHIGARAAKPSHSEEPDLTWTTLAFGADAQDHILLKFMRRFGRLHSHNMLLARCFSPALPNLLGALCRKR